MATIVQRLKSVPHHLPHGTAVKRGLGGVLVDKGERYGAAAAFGFSKGYYGEKFLWKGHGADLWIGVGSLAVATFLSARSNGRSKLAQHFERIGDAGLMSAVASIAASYGLEKAGAKVAVIKPAKSVSAVHGHHVLGAIGGAKPGPFLTPQQIANFAQRR